MDLFAPSHLLVLLLIILIIFGPSKLGDVGGALGKAIKDFKKADWITKILGADVKARFIDLKKASADRCPRLLGTVVKAPEVQFHHEVYTQYLWNQF